MTQTTSIDGTPPARTDRRAEMLLQVAGANKSFGRGIWPIRRKLRVLDGADLRVYRGEIVGLVGENGSGKSTLMQIVVGLLAADGGTVQRPESLGFCPQSPMLWDKLTVDEHFSLFARAYDMNETVRDRAISALLEELQFERYRGFLVEQLSGGTKQKLNLALALMHDPELLLLDEPYSGFDWETYLRFWEMSESRRNDGMGILIVSHFLSERDRLDRVYTLADGKTSEG